MNRIWKVTINSLGDNQPLDTYQGVAHNANQAVKRAMECARADRIAAIKEIAENEQLTADEIAEEKQVELYASEVVLVSDVEFGI